MENLATIHNLTIQLVAEDLQYLQMHPGSCNVDLQAFQESALYKFLGQLVGFVGAHFTGLKRLVCRVSWSQ